MAVARDALPVRSWPRTARSKRDAERNLSGIRCRGERHLACRRSPALASAAKASPSRSGPIGGEGELFLEAVPAFRPTISTSASRSRADVAAHIQRHALLKAAEESAEARSRLTLARDLHDSVVQFLAGAAFRLEAMKRSNGSGRDIEPELDELKQLMLQEQRELRSFITALRSGPLVAFNDLAKDLQALADRLSRQWDVDCEFLGAAGRNDDPDPAAPRRAAADARGGGQCGPSRQGQVGHDRARRR